MIFQDPFSSLNPRHSIGRILMEGPMVNGMSRERAGMKARELLNMVGLDPSSFSRYPHEFSGGQRQRVGIARALSLDPEFLVADEAVSALDVSVQAQVLVLLQRLQRQLGLAILFITHDLRVAAQICDRVAVMHQGKLVEQGPTAKLFEHPAHEYTKGLIAAIPGSGWEPPVLAVS
jgi:ATPase components of various ABC-type transport systems, contain duplicated ATPase